MTTPGFTAEASLGSAWGHYRQISMASVAAAGLLGLAQLESPVLQSPAQSVAIGRIDRYGKWCGVGHSGPGTPIDAVDEVCCRHDHCYCENGYLECKCDRDLLADMPGAIADPDTPAGGRAFGAAAMAFFTASPCVCWREICYPWPGLPPWRCSDVPIPGIPGLKIC
jgi:hypothetical protein